MIIREAMKVAVATSPRESCRTRATHFVRQIKSMKTKKSVKIVPFVNLMCSCNHKSLFLDSECLL